MSASIILPLLLLHVYVCFAVIFEEPLVEKNKEFARKSMPRKLVLLKHFVLYRCSIEFIIYNF